MPQIREYISRVEGAGPIRGPRADTGASDFVARGMDRLGEGIMNAGSAINKRNEQDEVSDLTAQMAQQHADWKTNLDDQTQKGTLDVDQFKLDVADSMDQIQQGVKTRAGGLFFKEQSAQLQSHMLQSAAQSQAHLAGEKAVVNYQSALNSSSSALVNDPSSFDFTAKQTDAGVDALVATGGLPAEHADELKLKGKQELAKSAVLGWSKLDPKMAKDQLDSGKWDQYFDGDVKQQLYGRIKAEENAKYVEQERIDSQQKKALEKQQEVTKSSFIDKIESSSLSTRDILDSNLDARDKEHYINLTRQMSDQKLKDDDPAKWEDTFQRIHLPDGDPNKIYDDSQILPMVGNGISYASLKNFRNEIEGKGTPEGKVMAQNRKQLMDFAKAQLIQANPMMGQRDPLGQQQLNLFYNDLVQAESNQKKNGKPVMDLFNANSPDWFGKNISKYTKTPDQLLKQMGDSMRKPVAPKVGDVVDGYTYNGGDLKDQKNWTKQSPAEAAATPPPDSATDSVLTDQTPSAKTAANDDLGFLSDSLGLSGPERDKALKEQEDRRKKNRDYFKRNK